MSRDKQRLIDYLKHILEAINRIQNYIEDIDEPSFLTNELIQDAVIRNLEIIGEASRNIGRHYPEYAQQHASVPFTIAYEMRNALARIIHEGNGISGESCKEAWIKSRKA